MRFLAGYPCPKITCPVQICMIEVLLSLSAMYQLLHFQVTGPGPDQCIQVQWVRHVAKVQPSALPLEAQSASLAAPSASADP